MNEVTLIEDVLRIVRREVGPVGLVARIEIERAIEAVIEFERDDDGWRDDDDDGGPRKPKPDAPTPPDDGPAAPRDLYALFDLKVLV